MVGSEKVVSSEKISSKEGDIEVILVDTGRNGELYIKQGNNVIVVKDYNTAVKLSYAIDMATSQFYELVREVAVRVVPETHFDIPIEREEEDDEWDEDFDDDVNNSISIYIYNKFEHEVKAKVSIKAPEGVYFVERKGEKKYSEYSTEVIVPPKKQKHLEFYFYGKEGYENKYAKVKVLVESEGVREEYEIVGWIY